MMFIHFFNIITYTALASTTRALNVIRRTCDPVLPSQEIDYYRYGNYEAIMILITNMFQLYVDCFALYLIMSFTKEKRNSMEQTSYDRLLRRDVPNMVFIRN